MLYPIRFFVNFFQSRISPQILPFSFLKLDFHNHILPGLDDGIQDSDESVFLLTEFNKLGFTSVISSPKTEAVKYPNTPKAILRRYTAFSNAVDDSSRALPLLHPPVSLYALDAGFSYYRKSGDLLISSDGYVLVNFVDSVALSFMEAEIIELIYAGYKPVLVQPERYITLHGNISYFEALVSRGCSLGLSLLSIQGSHGKAIQKMAFKLLENELYSFACTGLSHASQLKYLKSLAKNARIMKKMQEYPFLNSSLIKSI